MTTTTASSGEQPRSSRQPPRRRPVRPAVALALSFLLLAVAGAGGARAGETAAPPRARVILTVTGAIGEGGRGGPVSLTLDELERLGTAELETETPFTQGTLRFTGVPLRRLLDAMGARGETIRATALNDYAVDIPLEDATRHDVLLATRLDGKPMPVRDKGPIWVVYPWSQRPGLKDPRFGSRSIWQLRSLEIR